MRTLVGVELLRDSGWAGIAHVRSAALVHAASVRCSPVVVVVDTLQHTVDALSSARPTVNLQAIFGAGAWLPR